MCAATSQWRSTTIPSRGDGGYRRATRCVKLGAAFVTSLVPGGPARTQHVRWQIVANLTIGFALSSSTLGDFDCAFIRGKGYRSKHPPHRTPPLTKRLLWQNGPVKVKSAISYINLYSSRNGSNTETQQYKHKYKQNESCNSSYFV